MQPKKVLKLVTTQWNLYNAQPPPNPPAKLAIVASVEKLLLKVPSDDKVTPLMLYELSLMYVNLFPQTPHDYLTCDLAYSNHAIRCLSRVPTGFPTYPDALSNLAGYLLSNRTYSHAEGQAVQNRALKFNPSSAAALRNAQKCCANCGAFCPEKNGGHAISPISISYISFFGGEYAPAKLRKCSGCRTAFFCGEEYHADAWRSWLHGRNVCEEATGGK